jgi:hypothetical protein
MVQELIPNLYPVWHIYPYESAEDELIFAKSPAYAISIQLDYGDNEKKTLRCTVPNYGSWSVGLPQSIYDLMLNMSGVKSC